MRPRIKQLLIAVPVLIVLGLLIYQLPPVKSRLEWRIANWRAQIWRTIFPPEEAVFVPSGGNSPSDQGTEIALQVTATLRALTSSPSPLFTSSPFPLFTSTPTSLPPDTPTPTLSPTPIPATVLLTGILHEYEQWNNCGPATLAMQLSYWGWVGDQRNTALFLKPNARDKNVSPDELIAYVETQTEWRALYRVGGNDNLLKQLIAAGFPTIVEKTLDLIGVDGWIGHYALVSGYDDANARFITQDSYIQANFPEPYDKLAIAWQSFNYTFLVVYPSEREAELLGILGSLADSNTQYPISLEIAEEQIATSTGLPLYFAWFNKGTSLVGLGDYTGAAAAYDMAFSIYAQLLEAERPWRMVWYQHGPYKAYFEAGRYQDVINLADTTLFSMGEQTVEETFYWRGLAKEKLGDVAGALADMEHAVELNSNYGAALEELRRLQAGG
jgi:tetratricopeptide (TPR) repeat protein